MAFRSEIPLYQQSIFKVFMLEGSLVVVVALLFLLVKGIVAGYSAMIGGLIAFFPNVYFAVKFFRYFGAQSMPVIAASLWMGEAMKFVLTIGLFILVFFRVKPLNEVVLFTTYFIMLIASANIRLLLVRKV